jgi:hypothetical protein
MAANSASGEAHRENISSIIDQVRLPRPFPENSNSDLAPENPGKN